MTISDSPYLYGSDLEDLANQARMIDQLSELKAIADQIDELNRYSPVERARREYAAFKLEHDRVLSELAQFWANLRDLYGTVGFAPWISYKILNLRRLASQPMMRFKLSLLQALAHSTPASQLILGTQTRQLFAAHPPIAPPSAA